MRRDSGLSFAGPMAPALIPQRDTRSCSRRRRTSSGRQPFPYGQSSPVLAGGHLYLTANEGDKLLTICLDATTGRELWRRELRPSTRHKIYKANDPASPSPAADADGVVVFFPDFGLAAYTPDGKDRWTVPLGPFKSFYGMAASPILTEDLAVLVCDQQSGSFVIAVDRKTGSSAMEEGTGRRGGWLRHADGVPARQRGPAQLIVLGSIQVDSYAVGHRDEQRWWLPIGSNGAMGTALPAVTRSSSRPQQRRAVAADLSTPSCRSTTPTRMVACPRKEFSLEQGFGRALRLDRRRRRRTHHGSGVERDPESRTRANFGAMAIRPGKCAAESWTPKTVLWRFKKNLPYIPAPLVYQNVFYMVKDGGIITALDAATGQALKEGGLRRRWASTLRHRWLPTARCSWLTPKARSRC